MTVLLSWFNNTFNTRIIPCNTSRMSTWSIFQLLLIAPMCTCKNSEHPTLYRAFQLDCSHALISQTFADSTNTYRAPTTSKAQWWMTETGYLLSRSLEPNGGHWRLNKQIHCECCDKAVVSGSLRAVKKRLSKGSNILISDLKSEKLPMLRERTKREEWTSRAKNPHRGWEAKRAGCFQEIGSSV